MKACVYIRSAEKHTSVLSTKVIFYLRQGLIGVKTYLLNEDMSRLEQARRHCKR